MVARRRHADDVGVLADVGILADVNGADTSVRPSRNPGPTGPSSSVMEYLESSMNHEMRS